MRVYCGVMTSNRKSRSALRASLTNATRKSIGFIWRSSLSHFCGDFGVPFQSPEAPSSEEESGSLRIRKLEALSSVVLCAILKDHDPEQK